MEIAPWYANLGPAHDTSMSDSPSIGEEQSNDPCHCAKRKANMFERMSKRKSRL